MATVQDQHLLSDLDLELLHQELRPVYQVGDSHTRLPDRKGWRKDFDLISGRRNLQQAVVMRLLTPRGELRHLGHPDYGARVHELIGSGNTETNRNLLKLFILEALKREPRIEKVTELSIIPSPGTRSTVDVTLTVLPVGFSQVVEIGPFRIELG
ncbi:GPW/gp25 family protein [Hahella ganghwensis]|uniref:GPW/gp25 family protein n=1 Tax=Hahella ganghwensis TaxID=286420 RepID=UPI00035C83BF|nr:GPW/gp25 family protein [Hahella ganghwensis]